MPGYYNGDGRTDIVVSRPTTGRWHVRAESQRPAAATAATGRGALPTAVQWPRRASLAEVAEARHPNARGGACGRAATLAGDPAGGSFDATRRSGMPQAIGVTLQRARERLGLGLSDLADELDAREVELRALEQRSTAGLWSARERALLRVYARRLNVDAEPALREMPFAEREGPAAAATAAGRWSVPAGDAGHRRVGPRSPARAGPPPRRRRPWVAAAGFMLLVAATVAATLIVTALRADGALLSY